MTHSRQYPIQGVIFDLDGTLIDSEPNYYEADRQWFESFGVTLTPEMKRPYVGMGNQAMVRMVREQYGLEEPEAELLKWKRKRYLELARKNTVAFPEMVKLVRSLQQQELPLAVASGSALEIIEELLTLTDLRDAFGVLLSAEQVPRHKPQPDIFLKSARRMGIEPKHLAVVEDSKPGVQAGLRAGMRVLAVPSFPEPPLDPAFFKADWLVEGGMSDFKAESALGWLCNMKP